MIVYGVHSKFYDNGKVEAYMRQYDVEEKPENKYKEYPRYDSYTDYYTNKKEAEKAVDEARRA